MQASISFAVWILYGILLARRASRPEAKLKKLSRHSRAVLGPLLMMGGGAVLLGAIALVATLHGIGGNSLTIWAWLVITAGGLAFIHMQSRAALLMVSLAIESEPTGGGQASEGRITDRNSDEAKTTSRS